MERKIGEIFTYGNKTYQVVKVGIGIGCKGCAFETSGCSTYKFFLGHCFYIFRRDNTRVIFKLINNNMEIKNNQLTIEIPEGMEIDLQNSNFDTGVICFKKKQPEFKDGDIVTQGVLKGVNVCIIKNCIDKIDNKYNYYARYNTQDKEINYDDWSHISPFAKFATGSEKQQLFEALAKEGKHWDA